MAINDEGLMHAWLNIKSRPSLFTLCPRQQRSTAAMWREKWRYLHSSQRYSEQRRIAPLYLTTTQTRKCDIGWQFFLSKRTQAHDTQTSTVVQLLVKNCLAQQDVEQSRRISTHIPASSPRPNSNKKYTKRNTNIKLKTSHNMLSSVITLSVETCLQHSFFWCCRCY